MNIVSDSRRVARLQTLCLAIGFVLGMPVTAEAVAYDLELNYEVDLQTADFEDDPAQQGIAVDENLNWYTCRTNPSPRIYKWQRTGEEITRNRDPMGPDWACHIGDLATSPWWVCAAVDGYFDTLPNNYVGTAFYRKDNLVYPVSYSLHR